jgi:hypothetical protein
MTVLLNEERQLKQGIRITFLALSGFLFLACASLPRDPKETLRQLQSRPVLTGEAFIVPKDEYDLLNRLRHAYDVAHAVDWRLHDVNIVPVHSLE